MANRTRGALMDRIATEKCELLFLRAAAGHPKIRLEKSLRENVFVPLQSTAGEIKRLKPGDMLPLPPEFDHLIKQWAQGHNLDYEWVIRHARRTLEIWLVVHPAIGAFESIPELSPPAFQPPLRLPGESDSDYRKRQVQQFRDTIDQGMREVKRSGKHIPQSRGSETAHYRWAAEHLCLGWTWAQIARKNGAHVSYQAVRQAGLAVFERIGIPDFKPNDERNDPS
jgi:hypothetical protein